MTIIAARAAANEPVVDGDQASLVAGLHSRLLLRKPGSSQKRFGSVGS